MVGDFLPRRPDRAHRQVPHHHPPARQVVRFLYRQAHWRRRAGTAGACSLPSPSRPRSNRFRCSSRMAASFPMIPARASSLPPKMKPSNSKSATTATRCASGNLYDDDGTTFDYEKDDRTWTVLKVEKRNQQGQMDRHRHDRRPGRWPRRSHQPAHYSKIHWTMMGEITVTHSQASNA